VDIANASRNMKPKEIEEAKKNTGKEPKEFVVGYDALAIFVHKDNPLETISMEELGTFCGADQEAKILGDNCPEVGSSLETRVSRSPMR
jgi:phosphate transport system substrate-binding protein